MIPSGFRLRWLILPLFFGLLFFHSLLKIQAEEKPPAGVTFASLLHDLTAPLALTRPAAYTAGMISTWDRSGGNRDADNFVEVRGDVAVLADLEGPGVITRIFSAEPGGRVQIYLDDNPQPLVDLEAVKLFSGESDPFWKPLAGHEAGSYSYVPIPFAIRCRILVVASPHPAEKKPWFGIYWQISYRRYPAGTSVESLSLPLPAEIKTAWPTREALAQSPLPLASCRPVEVTVQAQRQAQASLFQVEGAGLISNLEVSVQEAGTAEGQDYLLEAFWDHETTPSLILPLPWTEPPALQTPPRNVSMKLIERIHLLYTDAIVKTSWTGNAAPSLRLTLPWRALPFPMFFSNGVSLVAVGDGPGPAATIFARFTLCPAANPPEFRLHAWYHQEWTQPHPGPNNTDRYNYPILHAQGQGLYVATALMVWNKYFTWWGEGDEMVFVDGKSWPPAFHGTGTEDYFDGAWSKFGLSPFAGAVVADSLGKGHAGRAVVWRWHQSDPIPFTQSLDFSLEHGSLTNDLDNLYASIAFWYQKEPHAPMPSPPSYTERKLDQKNLEGLVWREWRKEMIGKISAGLRVAALGILVLLALFPVVLFGVRMLRRKGK